MSDVDRRILGYMACHPLVLVSHVRALLGVQKREVTEHLDALLAAGLVRNGPRLRHQRAGYQITAEGLREIGSELPVPRLALRRYWQDIGVAWLSVAAQAGKFGEVDRVYCEREMRVADDMSAPGGQPVDPGGSPVRSKAAEASFGIRLDGADSDPQAVRQGATNAPVAAASRAALRCPDSSEGPAGLVTEAVRSERSAAAPRPAPFDMPLGDSCLGPESVVHGDRRGRMLLGKGDRPPRPARGWIGTIAMSPP